MYINMLKDFVIKKKGVLILATSVFTAIILIVSALLISIKPDFSWIIKDNITKVVADGNIKHDESAKKVTLTGNAYTIIIDYNKKFQIKEVRVNNSNVLDTEKGISLAIGTINNDNYSSLSLESSPEISINGSKVTFSFSGQYTNDIVTFICGKLAADVKFQRTFKKDVVIFSQSFPVINLRHNAIENIRWERSGANFWIDGKASSMRNFLAAGTGYSATKGQTGSELGNIKRTMEDITFTILSSEKNNNALSFFGYVEDRNNRKRPFATEVQRYESGNLKNLEMNINLSGPNKDLSYLTGNKDGWMTTDRFTGRIRPQGAKTFMPVSAKKGQIDTLGFIIQPKNYEDYYDLGDLKGVDEKQISSALNNYGRLMIMDYNMGTALESPTYFLELPALEQHWNTNIISLLGDDGSNEAQKNGMRVIRDNLQAPDGHITSPYPSTRSDGWGNDYGDMMPGYVISVSKMYNITGDKAFADEMRVSIEKAMQSQYDRYVDKKKFLCINLNMDDLITLQEPHNDYWEKSRGQYNGYVTAMYYEALVNMTTMERLVYKDEKKAKIYEQLAVKVKEAFNTNMWSEKTNTYLYGSVNLDVRYLPVQSAALKTDLVPVDRVKLLVKSVEREMAIFDLPFHVMNVRDLVNINRSAPQSNNVSESMLGENGGWYGAPDGDFYSGLPAYGDRTLIPRYMKGFTENFSKTGFIGATTYMRDGVTPADYGWSDCMPSLVYPIWGLYTYGYGFQPQCDRLNISPFIDKSMEGSVVKYRWRSTDLSVTYHNLFKFTLKIDKLPTNIYFNFINQTPNKEYIVKIGSNKKNVKADSTGKVSIKVEKPGETTVELLNPNNETIYDANVNLALNNPVAASTSLSAEKSVKNWPDLLSDGSYESGYWTPEKNDKFPWVRLDLGKSYAAKNVKIYVVDDDTYRYIIEGSNDPQLVKWDKLVDRKDNGVVAGLKKPIEEKISGNYHYIRIKFNGTASGGAPKLLEIEAGKVNAGAPNKLEIKVSVDADTNIALDKQVTCGTKIDNSNWLPDKVVDGKKTSDGLSAGYSSSPGLSEDRTEWFMVNLSKSYKINKIILAPRNDPGNVGNFFPKDYKIEVSTDGNTWTTIFSKAESEKIKSAFEIKFNSVNAQYVKFTATKLRYEEAEKTARLQLAEFEVYPSLE